MAILNKLKHISIAQRKADEALYSIVAQEMEGGIRHDGLWLKALEITAGDTKKQVSEYIKLRVQSLKDDVSILADRAESQHINRQARDIEEFITLLQSDASVEKIERYFSDMNSKEIASFVNTPDACEDYPIHVVINKGRTDLAEWLLQAGADPTVRNYWGSRPLDSAVADENQEAVTLLERYSK